MVHLFNLVLYQPIFNLLIFFYNIIPGHDIGLAIIALTVVVKLVLSPFTWQSLKSQKSMQDLQPKLSALKIKFKDQKDKIASETMKLYKENKVNPLSSCLPLLIQFPFLLAVYYAFRRGLTSADFSILYPFVHNPGQIDTLSFGLINLAVPNVLLSILAGIAQYVQTRMLSTQKTKPTPGSRDENMMASMNKGMLYFMPFMTIFIGLQLPAGLTFYWFLTTVLTVFQQMLMFRKQKSITVIPPAAPEAKSNA